MSHGCRVMTVKYTLIRCGQMRQKKIEIKSMLTILTSYLKLLLILS